MIAKEEVRYLERRILRALITIANVLVILSSLVTSVTAAELYKRVTFLIRPEAIVKSDEIRLGDIATFGKTEKEFEELVTRLKSIKLGEAPAPKTRINLVGATILEKIQLEGVSKESIGYSIPRTVTVEREGRVVSRDEVLTAIKQELWKLKNSDIQVRDVEWANAQVVPSGDAKVRAEILGEPVAGKIPVRLEVVVNNEQAARFLATGIADDWREVPILNRLVDRGGVISSSDLQLVRTNLADHPSDTVSVLTDLVGKRARARLQAGEVIRRSNVDIPPMIPKGKKVSIVFDRGLLRASATGVALEDGFEGSMITLRNESSKKTVIAKVMSPETTEVSYAK